MMARVAPLADILSFEGLEPKPTYDTCECTFCLTALAHFLNQESYIST